MGKLFKRKVSRLILVLLLALPAYSQEKPIKIEPYTTGSTTIGNGSRINLNSGFKSNINLKISEKVKLKISLGMMVGGVLFTTAYLTNKNYYGSTYNNQQFLSNLFLTSGITLFVGGVSFNLNRF